MFTEKQIAALKYLIFKAKDGDTLTKRVLAFLIDQSEELTKEVCVTLTEGRVGYTADEIHTAGLGFGAMGSSNCTTHLNELLTLMGSDLMFSCHYGDFDPRRNDDPFDCSGQFPGLYSQVTEAKYALKGMSMRYTFWLAKGFYSRHATLVLARREEIELIDLKKPGLYSNESE